MNTQLRVLELESKISSMRFELVDDYLLNSGINPSLLNENDKISIYTMLTIKAEKYKKEHLDKLK